MRNQLELKALQKARKEQVWRDNFRASKRNVLNEDLLLPEWAKKDESLREKFTEKKKYTKVNPDRLEPILE